MIRKERGIDLITKPYPDNIDRLHYSLDLRRIVRLVECERQHIMTLSVHPVRTDELR